jgi:hypothetical protein
MGRFDRAVPRRVCAILPAVEATNARSFVLPTLSVPVHLGVSRQVALPDPTTVATTRRVVASILGNEVVLPWVAGNPEECIT